MDGPLAQPEPPGNVPLFPLPQVVLLPGALLPLHIFEPRYQAMMESVLEQPRGARWMATALLRDGFEEAYETLQAPIRSVVCVGQVMEHSRLAGGRFNLVLLGRWRGRILAEDCGGAFRVAHIDVLESDLAGFGGRAPEVVRNLELTLDLAIKVGLVEHRLVEWITEVSQSGEQLVDMITFYVLPAEDAGTKQRILAARNVLERYRVLSTRLAALVKSRRRAARGEGPRKSWTPPNCPN